MVEWVMDAEKNCCSRVLGIVRELSSDCYSKIVGESGLPYSRHISPSLEEISKEELDMRGAQERKKDKDDQQQVLSPSGKSNPSTSLTNTPPSPSTAGVTVGRIGRQNSFALKPSYGVTPSDLKTSLKSTDLRGVATPTFLFEEEEGTLEESKKKPLIFIRPTERVGTALGWKGELDLDIDEDEKEPQIERVETERIGWKGELDLDIDEDENEPQPGDYSSTPCSLIKTVVFDKAEDEDDKSLSPLFSTPRQRFDQSSHTSDLEEKEVNVNVKATCEKEGSEGFSGRSTTSSSPTSSSTSSSKHPSSTSTLSDDDKCNVHDKPLTPALPVPTELYVNQAPSTTCGDQTGAQPEQHQAEDQPEAQHAQHEGGSAGLKIPSASSIAHARCPMRTQVTRYVRRSSSSCIPTQESDLLKEWTRKSLEEREARENKSTKEQKKILEAAQRTRDAFYEQRRVDMDLKRAQNRQQEKQVVEETSNHPKFQKSTNPWGLVVSLVNLERPTGPPAQKDDTKRLSPSSTQVQLGPPSLPTKPLPTNAAIKEEKTKLAGSNSAIKQDKTNLTGPKDGVIQQIPSPLKNTDLSRMKEILVKLKYKSPVREGDGK